MLGKPLSILFSEAMPSSGLFSSVLLRQMFLIRGIVRLHHTYFVSLQNWLSSCPMKKIWMCKTIYHCVKERVDHPKNRWMTNLSQESVGFFCRKTSNTWVNFNCVVDKKYVRPRLTYQSRLSSRPQIYLLEVTLRSEIYFINDRTHCIWSHYPENFAPLIEENICHSDCYRFCRPMCSRTGWWRFPQACFIVPRYPFGIARGNYQYVSATVSLDKLPTIPVRMLLLLGA